MRSAMLILGSLTVMFPGGTDSAKPPFYADKANLLVYFDASGKSLAVNTLADWQKRREHILANMQLVMGPLPAEKSKVPLDVQVEAEETLDKVIRKKITFAVAKDDRCSAYLLVPRNLKGKAPALLCLHQTTAIGKGEPAGVGGRKYLRYALELAERGYVTLAPDYPNFGGYKIDVYARGYVSATMKGIWNHKRGVDLLQSLPQVDGAKIGCIGHSLGGHNSLFVAAFDPRLKVVVTSCGFNSFFKYEKGNLAGWSHKGYMPRIASDYQRDAAKMPFDFTEILGAMAPRAVFINAPLGDSNFEVSGVRDCVSAAKPVYQLHNAAANLEAVYPNAGHDFPPEIRAQAYAFIDRHLKMLPKASTGSATERILDGRLHHLRVTKEREWSDFPQQPHGRSLSIRFAAEPNRSECCLRLRQQDVRQSWKVTLNGKEIGRLILDENDTVIYLPMPAGGLIAGGNTLLIEQIGRIPDDIRVGEIALDDRPVREVLSEGSVAISVQDVGQSGKPAPTPCRLTIVNAQGALATVGATSNDHLAVRPGVIYTGTGRASFGLPAGDYTIYAGRGFAYGLDSVRITVKPGDVIEKTLSIRHEVPTPGFVSSDTHIHSLTYSGHGDATIAERVLAIAGEGIELPIATEHNLQVDYHAAAVKHGVRQYFTPVVGNEVTTAVGHFNVFPCPAGGDVPDFRAKDWKAIFASIDQKTGAKVVILNHPWDLHSGYRPFGPEHHNALTGENLDGWELQANGMEVVNSGAQQSDWMRPYRAWFGLLNRGIDLTPVGGSDSHDVSRFLVGQARTYIRCRDAEPGKIDVAQAVANFRKGQVLVSCGLLTEMTVNDEYGPGDLVPAAKELKVAVRVLGPSWVTADTMALFANGIKIREVKIAKSLETPVKWTGAWTLPSFRHDVQLVAIASGPGVEALYWPIAKPYQATSPRVDRRVIGSTGAVWVDGDGDGRRTSAFAYAQHLVQSNGPEPTKLLPALADYDEAVAIQVASLLQGRGVNVLDRDIMAAARKAGPHVERGFAAFAEAWRECQIARKSTPK